MKLLLKTIKADFSAHSGFVYPREVGTRVAAPDWNDRAECGGGLHWLLWGEGNASLMSSDEDAIAIVGSVDDDVPIVDLGGKVKVPYADIVFIGKLRDAANYIVANATGGKSVHYGTATAGYAGTATAGYAGTATAGDAGTATAGDAGTATAGYAGTATAGYEGTATAGTRGTATAGDAGTATAGYEGTATAGYAGTIIIKRWNGKRYKFVVGYIGEEGLEPNVAYKLDDVGCFVKVAKP